MATLTINNGYCGGDLNYPCFGYLYNWYAIDDSRELTSNDDWSVSTTTQFDLLVNYLGGDTVAGGELKDTGVLRWNTPNTGATNNYGFTAIGIGKRVSGIFNGITLGTTIMSLDLTSIFTTPLTIVSVNTTAKYLDLYAKSDGHCIRLVKDATGLDDGVTTTYAGNDGKTYNAIVINELYWTTENLEETLYRDLSVIPNVTDNTAWAALTTGALCLYDNNEDYACQTPLPVPVTTTTTTT